MTAAAAAVDAAVAASVASVLRFHFLQIRFRICECVFVCVNF